MRPFRPTTNEEQRRWLACALPWLLYVLALILFGSPAHSLPEQTRPASVVDAVDSVGMTVADMDRSVDFYTHVLTFVKTSDVEVAGSEWERLQGVFGLRMRIVRLKLGDESTGRRVW